MHNLKWQTSQLPQEKTENSKTNAAAQGFTGHRRVEYPTIEGNTVW
jgi:hypothetical protein